MFPEFVVNAIIVLGLAVVVSLSWVGFPANAGWSRFLGSVVFYIGIELALWFITHPQIQEWRSLSIERPGSRRQFPPE